MLRKLYYSIFGGMPKYVIVKYKGNYFPLKKKLTNYRYMIDNGLGKTKWSRETSIESVCLSYPNLHAYGSLISAKKTIRKLDGVELKEVDWDPPKWFSKPHEEYYFEPKTDQGFVKKKNSGTSKDKDRVITA